MRIDNARRLTSLELAEWKGRLCQPQSPQQVLDLCQEIGAIAGDYVLTQPGTQFWREAFIGGRFGLAREYELLRLSAGERPDIELYSDGKWTPFEVTEADDPNRRRNEEYKRERTDQRLTIPDPEEEWRARRKAIPEALRRCVMKKIDLPYAPECGLLIYLNLGTYGCWEQEIRQDIQSNCQAAIDRFSEVWVLWSEHVIQIERRSSDRETTHGRPDVQP